MNEPTARESKLPKWAQEELQSLRTEIRYLKEENARLRYEAGGDDTDTWLNSPSLGQDLTPLPKGETVHFGDKNFRNRNQILCRWEDSSRYEFGLQVMSTGGRLVVLPKSSNSFIVRCDRDE